MSDSMGAVAAAGRIVDSRLPRASVTPAAGDADPRTAGRALVPVAPAAPNRHRRNTLQRPSAAFLAHLIAANRNLPQARERRRAEPREAIAAYAAAARAA